MAGRTRRAMLGAVGMVAVGGVAFAAGTGVDLDTFAEGDTAPTNESEDTTDTDEDTDTDTDDEQRTNDYYEETDPKLVPYLTHEPHEVAPGEDVRLRWEVINEGDARGSGFVTARIEFNGNLVLEEGQSTGTIYPERDAFGELERTIPNESGQLTLRVSLDNGREDTRTYDVSAD